MVSRSAVRARSDRDVKRWYASPMNPVGYWAIDLWFSAMISPPPLRLCLYITHDNLPCDLSAAS